MLLLKTTTFPSSAAELACLLNESFRQLFLVDADPVTIRDKSYPHLKELSIALDGASLRDNPPRPSSVQGAVKPAVTVDRLEINASALTLSPAVIDVSLSARAIQFVQARNADEEIVLSIVSAADGRIEIAASPSALEALVTRVAQSEASKHGVTIDSVQLKLRAKTSRSLAAEVRLRARKLFLNASIRISGQLDLDDELIATISGLDCNGEGTIATLACGILRPHLQNSTAASSHSWRCRWAKSACAMSTSPLATNSPSRLNSAKQGKLPACDSIRHKRPAYATLAALHDHQNRFRYRVRASRRHTDDPDAVRSSSRQRDLRTEEKIVAEPDIPLTDFSDLYGNRCARVLAPTGNVRFSLQALIEDSGQPDEQCPDAIQHPVEELPSDTLPFLLTSRYCEVDKLSDIAWQLFGGTAPGWPRVKAICDWVHNHITFGYHFADATKSAFDVYNDARGVCRDFSHLALAFCRCMNIPARYVTGYMGDIGVPLVLPMDFSGWFEVYLGGRWYTFDARHNVPASAASSWPSAVTLPM